MTYQVPADVALIIVDMQNGFCDGGGLAVAGGHEIVPIINQLQQSFPAQATIATQDWHPADHSSFASNHPGAAPYDEVQMSYGTQRLWPDHCIQNTTDADFHPALTLSSGVRVIRKGTNRAVDSYSAFYEVDKKAQPRFDNGETLADTLKQEGKKILVLCGLAYDFCVGFSALDARAAGFEVIVLKNATRSVGIPLDQGTTETLMDQQLKDAQVTVIDDLNDLPRAIADIKNRKSLSAAVSPQP